MITDIAQEIDRMCAEYGHEGKNATQAIASKDEAAMWDLAEFFALDDEELAHATFEELKQKANNQ